MKLLIRLTLFINIMLCLMSTQAQTVFTVNSLADGPDAKLSDKICLTSLGKCTLRAAIEQLNVLPNNQAEPDQIYFDQAISLTSDGVIWVNSSLPEITSPMIIDSQLKEITIANAGSARVGFHLRVGSGGSTIRGLTIGGFIDFGILAESENNTFEDNYIGTNSVGARMSNEAGIFVASFDDSANDNLIRNNVVGYNETVGIIIGASANTIVNNYVGTNAAGDNLGNGGEGIALLTAGEGTQIGGTLPDEGNVIGFNGTGVTVFSSHNVIQNNYIGVHPNERNIGNIGSGIHLIGGNPAKYTGINMPAIDNQDADGNIIGYDVEDPILVEAHKANYIAYNQQGIVVDAGGEQANGNVFRGNVIFENTEISIDLGNDGASLFDFGDGDEGPNRGLNYPALQSLEYNPQANQIEISYGLTTAMETATYPLTIDFYIADSPNGGGVKQYLGTAHEAFVVQSTVFMLDAAGLDPALLDAVVATATDAAGNTSEFSPPLLPDTPLPVTLVSFNGLVEGHNVVLSWQTATETNNAGFEVQQRQRDDLPVRAIHESPLPWTPLIFIHGRGTTDQAQRYTYNIAGLNPGTHQFRLKQIDFDGAFAYSDIIETTIEVAGTHALSPAYPNPFNPQTTFTLAIPEPSHISITIHDALGRQVAQLHNGKLSSGLTHTFTFDGTGLASGVYLLRVDGGRFVETRRLMLVK